MANYPEAESVEVSIEKILKRLASLEKKLSKK